jgi:hypothetical protein
MAYHSATTIKMSIPIEVNRLRQRQFRDKSEANQPERCVTGPGGHSPDSVTYSTREIIYELSMAEANDNVSSTEPALSGAIAWIRRATSELRFGDMKKLGGHFWDTFGGRLRMMPAAETAWIRRPGGGL